MLNSAKQKLVVDEVVIKKALQRRLEPEGVFPNWAEAIKFLRTVPRRVYLGIDPTGPDIHLGHTIPLLFLKQLLELGHKPVIVIGDFTARIGDPTGKDSARKPLTPEEIEANMTNYISQIYKILPKGSFEVKHNGDWLGKLSFTDIVKLASNVTVQQMIQRDMFQERIKNERPIGLHEFLYPLMQGYDSVAMEIDGEVGGNDQTFNMLVGRELEKKLLNREKVVFATRLLVDAVSGKKMSKSEGGLIAVSDSPTDMFGKVMKTVPDEMIKTVFELCTEIESIPSGEEIQKNPYSFKKQLARDLVMMYHGTKLAEKALKDFENVFSEGKLPDKMVEWPGAGSPLLEFIHSFRRGDLSRSHIKKLFEQKAIKVNNKVVDEWDHELKAGDVVQIGAHQFVKVK